MLWASLKLGAIHKRCQNFFGHFWYPPSPCRTFDPHLPNFYLLISCHISISDPLLGPFPPKIFRRLLWMAPWFAVARTKGFSEIRLQQLPMPAAQVFQTEIRDFFFFRGFGIWFQCRSWCTHKIALAFFRSSVLCSFFAHKTSTALLRNKKHKCKARTGRTGGRY